MQYWVWLSQIRGIGPITQKKLLDYFHTPQSIFEASERELMRVSGIGPSLIQVIKSSSLDEAKRILEKVDRTQVKLLTYDNSLYPAKAKEAQSSPILLYYRGNIRKDSMGVGIVGSRQCTEYGKHVAGEAAASLADMDIPVISGMAKGIDGYAHTACLKKNGYTLAFLGNGPDICYPREHYSLFERIIANGAVLSQYPPGIQPKSEHFPKRNELMAGWCEKLLVVEAAEKSGALITAEYARELNREVLVAPSSIYSITGRGANQLIADGAHIYLKPDQLQIHRHDDVTERGKPLPPAEREKPKNKLNDRIYTEAEQKIIDLLEKNPMTMEQIGVHVKMEQMELMEMVSMLELEGIITLLPGGRWEVNGA